MDKGLLAPGVWPTMLTPFTESYSVDYKALEKMVDWYLERKVNGLFAVCQSSEMFFLTLAEREEIAAFVRRKAEGRVQVIASGHVSYALNEQIEEIKRIASTGIQAFVIVSNRFAGREDSDDVWKSNAEKVLNSVPDVSFGIYECPYPYKRVLSPGLLKWCADTGRFSFLKDTCCDAALLKSKIEAVKGSPLLLFNANSATLLGSLEDGAAGFSGVMANFHPQLYVWLCENWKKQQVKAKGLQDFLCIASMYERQPYPVNAKYHMQLEGIDISLVARSRDRREFTELNALEVRQLRSYAYVVERMLNL